MARALTARERAVLEHVVVDADAWWAHANNTAKIDAEEALALKVRRWSASYDTASRGGGYQKRAERTDHEPAE